MTKDVLITISGLQIADDTDMEPVEVITSGEYYCRNGKHYILYDEVLEGFRGVTKNRIKLYENCLDITKKGISNVHMVFEKNKKNVAYYETPFGSILLGVSASNFEMKETEDYIGLKVDYVLDINEEPLADCKIRIRIQSKDAGFSLKQ